MTLLTEKEVFDSPLEIFSKFGTKAAPTDYAILLGASVSGIDFTSEGSNLKDRTGYYWLRYDRLRDTGCVVLSNGFKSTMNFQFRTGGLRPVLSLSSVPTRFRETEIGAAGIKELRFGEYPQTAASKELQELLERGFADGTLTLTGRVFSSDSIKHDDHTASFRLAQHPKYDYGGRSFVRVQARSCYNGLPFTLSNGCSYRDGDPVWVETEPIIWLLDERSGLLVSKQILMSGIPFRHRDQHARSLKYTYEVSDLRLFLDRYFAAEAFPALQDGEECTADPGSLILTRDAILTALTSQR